MRTIVSWSLVVGLAVALVPGDADAIPPECRVARDLPSSNASRRTRRLLRGLIPSVYLRWRGRGTGTHDRGGHHRIGAPLPPDAIDRERRRRRRWEIGLRWAPLESVAALDNSDRELPEARDVRVDPDLCRRLTQTRRKLSSRSNPDPRTLLEEAILERRIEAVRRHE